MHELMVLFDLFIEGIKSNIENAQILKTFGSFCIPVRQP